jgi:hypothetical protein
MAYAKWALELMGLDIAYANQTAIKSYALADFLAEWTEAQQQPPPDTQAQWSRYSVVLSKRRSDPLRHSASFPCYH